MHATSVILCSTNFSTVQVLRLEHVSDMEVRTLSADLDAIARQDLNEDPNRIQEDLKHIRDWLTTQPHLKARTGSNNLTARYMRRQEYTPYVI
jgi:hypothetical protein